MSTLSLLLLLLNLVVTYSQEFDCEFTETYPKQYIAHKLQSGQSIELDGKLDDAAWQQIEFSDDFIDIENEVIPRFDTRMKIRWDDDFIYIGVLLMEPQIWANYTEDDMVIFHDNDIEVFFDPNGCNCYYKEFEMNALNKTWMLSLNKPYSVGGYENSTRRFPETGWTMKPLLKCATYVSGEVNNPKIKNYYWSVEMQFPIDRILDNQTYIHPSNNSFWRINLSRVQWHVTIQNYNYRKIQGVPEDNWVWSTQNVINMHVPSKWGILQFCDALECEFEFYDEWSIREIAMHVFNAQYAFTREGNDPTQDLDLLQNYSNVPFDGTCLIKKPEIELMFEFNVTNGTGVIVGYVISVENEDYIAVVNEEQYLSVISKKNNTITTVVPKDEDANVLTDFEIIIVSVSVVIVVLCILCVVKVKCVNKNETRQLL